ncbi:hypothetical protein A2154_03970 [Candidatus Gottesmanbacteria bacterium RBG_16_43_7]|uniref:HEPN domain-containing protein n=1 Tax=Candidatus Gottesmanbacteria bacterium RBG_16_43_7 TaxID=1798373 RepID=A0A1F5Z8D9_9BACT|nr:MAG: hypothetical protein A2154_03970 [Candidatus Gottesmanbacteria bacterium RBG_16_43_7]
MNSKLKILIDEGGLVIEKSIGWDQINKYLTRALKDLETAQKLIKVDEAVAMDLVYKALFHASNALIRANGVRPGKIRQHKAVVRAASIFLGKKANKYILRYEKLRIKRNEFEYGAVFRSSQSEINNGIKDTRKYIQMIKSFLLQKNPQKHLL